MKKNVFFVSYTLFGKFHDTTVSLNDIAFDEIPTALKQKIHPDRPGDPSDGMKAQFSKDCVLINYFKIGTHYYSGG